MSTIKSDNYEATTAGGNLIFKTNSIEKMRIVPDGTLTGVGVNLGGNALSLNANGTTVHIHEPTAGRASMLHCTSAAQGIGAAKGFICGMWSNNDAYCYTYDPVSLQFGTNGSIRMTITSAGDVGIGNSAPPCKLYVQGEARSSTSTTSASDANTLTTKDYVNGFVGRGAYTVYTLAGTVYGTAPTASAAGSYSPAVTTTTTRQTGTTYTSPANSSVHVHTMVNRNSGITVTVNGRNILYFSAANVGEYVNFIVPPNTTYSITAASGIGYWAEFIS